jgi:hypothetical protein
MNLNGHKEWRNKVIDHYGSIDAFEDARTIRTMLRFLHEKSFEDERIASEATPAGLKMWREAFAEERAEIVTYKKELEDWLTKRGLAL